MESKTKAGRPPFKLWIGASILGGIIGALSPEIIMPEKSLGIFISLFMYLIPCTLSTFVVYPWLYKKLWRFKHENRQPNFLNYVLIGTLFGIMATIMTVIFFTLYFLDFDGFILFTGLLIAFIMYWPMIIISGTLFAWLNYKWIGKSA